MRKSPVLLILLISLLLNAWFSFQWFAGSLVVSVPDGDSLQLEDGRRVRLLGVDAPERGRCFADVARSELERVAKGKHIRLKDTVTDDYGRTLAHIFVGRNLIQNDLVRDGLVRSGSPIFEEAATYAKENKLGIYSETCRKTTPPNGCAIKGNIREGKPVYYIPACKYYDQVIVDEAFGDEWFCTTSEAQKESFAPAPSCSR